MIIVFVQTIVQCTFYMEEYKRLFDEEMKKLDEQLSSVRTCSLRQMLPSLCGCD